MLDSAFRSGVQAALSIAKSWYPGIDLQLMTALQEGLEESIGELWTQICHIAQELANGMDLLEVTPYVDSAGQPTGVASISDLLYTTSEEKVPQSRPARQVGSENSHSSDYADDDAEEESEVSSDGHSVSAAQEPSRDPAKTTASSAPGGA